MKKIFLLCLCIIILIVAIPLTMALNTQKRTNGLASNPQKSNKSSETATTTSPQITSEDAGHIICEAMQYIDENSDKETKKAVIALCKNNYLFAKTTSNETLTSEITRYSDSLYEELEEIYADTNITLLYKGDRVYIPLTKTTNGFTETDENYPYITSIASPWDVLSEEYRNNSDIECGVSISGIEHLCANGADCKEALRWYLPYFEIT